MKPRRGHDNGSTTLWCLGLCLLLMSIGAVTIDVWRAFSARRAYASAADAAARAAANGIDEAHFRVTGEVVLDESRAEQLAYVAVVQQSDTPGITGIQAGATAQQVTVAVTGQVNLGLLGLFADEPFEITVTAVGAVPPPPAAVP
jgi:Flp pilus assembly protein TadG